MHSGDLLHLLVHTLLMGVSVFLVAKFMPGFNTKSFGSSIVFAVVAGVLNAVAWHYLRPLSLTFAVATLGVGALIINGILFLIAGKVSGVQISGCVTAALASLAVTVMNWIVNGLVKLVAPHWAS